MTPSRVIFPIGVLLILVGVFIRSSTLLESLRVAPPELLQQLLLGGALFKAGLVLLGLFLIAVAAMPICHSPIASEKLAPDPHNRIAAAILVAILVAATALRLYHLDSGLWLDEILTYANYVRLPLGEIISTYDDQNQHFLYSILAHLSLRILGEGTWSLRLPAALLGVASIWALYLFGREVSTSREALLSSALLTFSYHHIWFSQSARGYTGVLFWTLLSTWLFLRGLRDSRPRLWMPYAAAAALGVYTQMTMVFIIMGHFIIYLVTLCTQREEIRARRWDGIVFGFVPAALFTFQLHALILPQIFGVTAGEESTITAWTHPLWTVLELARGIGVMFAGDILAVGTLFIFGAGLVSFARTNPLVIELLMIPAAICAVVVIGLGHHLWPRFFFFTVGFGALVLVRGSMVLPWVLARLLQLPVTKAAPIGMALAAGLITTSAMSISSAYGPKQDYLGALSFVESRKKPGDSVVTVGLAAFPYKSFYKVDWDTPMTVDGLNSIRSRSKRTWLLYTLPPHLLSAYPEIHSSIQRDFTVVRKFYGTLGDGTIFVCRSDSPPQ